MPRSLLEILDEGNPNKIAAAWHDLRIGSLLALLPRFLATPVSNNGVVLPLLGKALQITRCFVSIGANPGRYPEFTNPGPMMPSPGTVGVSGSGDLVFRGSDACERVEVYYIAPEGQLVVDEEVDVIGNVAQLLFGRCGTLLISARALTGTTLGDKVIRRRGESPGIGEAALNDEGFPEFNATDAVTKARVTFIATPGIGSAPLSFGQRLFLFEHSF